MFLKKSIVAASVMLGVTFASISQSFSFERGDIVYTCRYYQNGFLWLSGSYEGCRAIITEEIGSSRFRIEYLSGFCVAHDEGDTEVVGYGKLLRPSQVEESRFGPTICDRKYFD